MAQQSSHNKWNRQTISQKLDSVLRQAKQCHIRLFIDVCCAYNHPSDITVDICGGRHTIVLQHTASSMQMLGSAILDLSKRKQYDRIINVYVDGESPLALSWMNPLLSEEFKSLISMQQSSGTRGWHMHFAATYNILCEMITNDKMIAIDLAFGKPNKKWPSHQHVYDFNKHKFLVDTTKLLNAIKATNALNIIYVNGTKPKICELIEKLLQEALSLNFSVTTLTTGYGYTSLTKPYKQSINKEMYNNFQKWWPVIKKRNEESQMFNKILVGQQDDDGIWNRNKCPYQLASKLLQSHFPTIPSLYFDKKGDRCFCNKCHSKRKDKLTYTRGKPPRKYALPVGWVRFGLKTDEAKCIMNKIWDEWHVAYHGTTKDGIPKIFRAGLILLKPGDNNASKPIERYNKYSKKKEMFDPNQIYVSPSIRYSGHGAYAKWIYCSHPSDRSRTLKIQFAFQLRIRPGSYCIGQETVGAGSSLTLDKQFSNNELEWYSKENTGIMLHGLMLHIKEVNIRLKKNHDSDDAKCD